MRRTLDIARLAADLALQGQPYVLATVVRAEAPASVRPGAKAIVYADGRVEGWIGGSCSEPNVVRHARHALLTGETELLRIGPEDLLSPTGVTSLTTTCPSGGTVDIFLEPVQPNPQLVVIGHTPVAHAVASIGEAAAEAIGARGLLVRVGAYFHDIGKMLKPAYFVENQGQQANRHESLVPAMSTLIIIAHVKEGVELARQYNLPQPLVDLIVEHHGTTLVEYFYRRATERSQADPNAADVDEQTYRYPGPKPTTRESAVMMIADAVESASRALTEPTPARIASLVHELAMKRLLDGQFDACGLTLEELDLIEQSLVKSLTAVYHGRVKYPDQRTA